MREKLSLKFAIRHLILLYPYAKKRYTYENSKNIKANYREIGIISYLYNLLENKKIDEGINLINNEKIKFTNKSKLKQRQSIVKFNNL